MSWFNWAKGAFHCKMCDEKITKLPCCYCGYDKPTSRTIDGEKVYS